MKWFAMLLLAGACKEGYVPTDTVGVCVEQAALQSWSSDELPPSDKMPSYQREGISIVPVKDMTQEDIKTDRDKADADAQGRAMAGLKPK